MGNRNSGRRPWSTFENEFEDFTGQKFGRWTVIERVDNNIYKQIVWKCVCECGWFRDVVGGNLKNGKSQSCGCLAAEKMSTRMKRQWSEGKFDHIHDKSNRRKRKLPDSES